MRSKVESATRQRPLSLSFYTVAELDALETIDVAAASGCRYVGLRLLGGQPGGGETELLLNPSLRRAFREAMASRRISALDANTVRLIPQTEVDDYLPFFDAAAELGARHVLTTVDDPETGRIMANLGRLCDIAAVRGLTIDFEFVPWLQLSNIGQTARLVRQCAHPALGISVDALHYFRSGGSPGQIDCLPPAWFRYAQMCDVASVTPPSSSQAFIDEATLERLPPGDGVIDLENLLRALPPGIPLALEVPQASLVTAIPAVDRVRRVVEAMRRVLQNTGTE